MHFPFQKKKTAAVLLAGGCGQRMAAPAGMTKQRMLLCGRPVLAHTALAFDACPEIDGMVAVVRAEEEAEMRRLFASLSLHKPVYFAKGGETRQESAFAGMEAVPKGYAYIAIHDGCRCLITPEQIGAVVQMAKRHRAACVGTPVTDTVKEVSPVGKVVTSPDRSRYWLAQTPQVFDLKLYRCVAYTARKKGLTGTDDSMLLEQFGQTVYMVDCGRNNLKLTTPEDLVPAEAILAARREKHT